MEQTAVCSANKSFGECVGAVFIVHAVSHKCGYVKWLMFCVIYHLLLTIYCSRFPADVRRTNEQTLCLSGSMSVCVTSTHMHFKLCYLCWHVKNLLHLKKKTSPPPGIISKLFVLIVYVLHGMTHHLMMCFTFVQASVSVVTGRWWFW